MSWLSWHPMDKVLVRESRWVVSIKGYRFNRLIFFGAVAFLFIVFVAVLSKYGDGRQLGWSCPSDSPMWCHNPFIDQYGPAGNCRVSNQVVCADAMLPPGAQVGSFAPPVVAWFPALTFFAVASAFLLNHLVYNRRGGV
jgi:hypothetical protein